MRKSSLPLPASLLTAALTLLASGATLLHAEDVIVTGCVGDELNSCPPSCPYNLDTMGLHSSASSAVPSGAARSKTVYGSGTNADLGRHAYTGHQHRGV